MPKSEVQLGLKDENADPDQEPGEPDTDVPDDEKTPDFEPDEQEEDDD